MSDTPTPDMLNGVERRFLSPLCGGISDVCHHSLCDGRYSWDDSAICRCACHKSDRPSTPPASARTVTRWWTTDEGFAPNPNGRWVKWIDVEPLLAEVASVLTALAKQEQEIARLKAQLLFEKGEG